MGSRGSIILTILFINVKLHPQFHEEPPTNAEADHGRLFDLTSRSAMLRRERWPQNATWISRSSRAIRKRNEVVLIDRVGRTPDMMRLKKTVPPHQCA
jgi:hypothetical protein